MIDKDAIYCIQTDSPTNFAAKILPETDEVLWKRNFGENSIDYLAIHGYHVMVCSDSKVQDLDLRVSYILVTRY